MIRSHATFGVNLLHICAFVMVGIFSNVHLENFSYVAAIFVIFEINHQKRPIDSFMVEFPII